MYQVEIFTDQFLLCNFVVTFSHPSIKTMEKKRPVSVHLIQKDWTIMLDNFFKKLSRCFFSNCLSFCICCRFDCCYKKPRTLAFLALFDEFDNSCQPKAGKIINHENVENLTLIFFVRNF